MFKKSDLKDLIIKETKRVLNENIQDELTQNNRKLGIHLDGEDEVGEFYVTVHPNEGDDNVSIVKKFTIPYLMQKMSEGEMSLDKIHSISKKEGSALRKSNKLLKEFNHKLKTARKDELNTLTRRRSGYLDRLNGIKKLSEDNMSDESTKAKLRQIEDMISSFDGKISDLQAKLKNK